MQNDLQFRGGGWGGGESSVICVHTAHPPAFQPTEVDFQSAVGSSRVQMSSRANLQYDIHCKKNWSENKSPFGIPIPPIVFSISLIQNLCSSPLAFLTIIEVGIKTLTLLMEINSITLSKKNFRCICLNRVGTVLSVRRIFSTPPPPPGTNQSIMLS